MLGLWNPWRRNALAEPRSRFTGCLASRIAFRCFVCKEMLLMVLGGLGRDGSGVRGFWGGLLPPLRWPSLEIHGLKPGESDCLPLLRLQRAAGPGNK